MLNKNTRKNASRIKRERSIRNRAEEERRRGAGVTVEGKKINKNKNKGRELGARKEAKRKQG